MNFPQLEIVVHWEDEDFFLSLAHLQGMWTIEQYLRLSDQTNRLVEFTDGVIEFIRPPTCHHQAILGSLFYLFHPFVESRGGQILFAALRLHVLANTFRNPDILLLLDAKDPRRHNRYWEGADLVVEVVSPDDPERDTRTKRLEYAQAGIPEYWIVYPDQQQITVLRLDGTQYVEHGVFGRGDQATSVLLPGFSVDVNAVLDAD